MVDVLVAGDGVALPIVRHTWVDIGDSNDPNLFIDCILCALLLIKRG